MSIQDNPELTPREFVLMENERDENRLIREHAMEMKKLELEVKRQDNEAKIRLAELEAKWRSWLKLPSMLIKLPVYCLFGLGFIISMISKKEIPKDYWKYLN